MATVNTNVTFPARGTWIEIRIVDTPLAAAGWTFPQRIPRTPGSRRIGLLQCAAFQMKKTAFQNPPYSTYCQNCYKFSLNRAFPVVPAKRNLLNYILYPLLALSGNWKSAVTDNHVAPLPVTVLRSELPTTLDNVGRRLFLLKTKGEPQYLASRCRENAAFLSLRISFCPL